MGKRSIYGEKTNHPSIASSLYNIAGLYQSLGWARKKKMYYDSALKFNMEALKMRRYIYGEKANHPDIAESLGSVAHDYKHIGDKKNAKKYKLEALEMKRRSLNGKKTNRPKTATSSNNDDCIIS